MRDNSGRIILLLAMVILVFTAGGLWLFLNRGADPTPGLVDRLIGGEVTLLDSSPDPAFGSGGAARIQGPAILAPAALLVDDAAIHVVVTAAQVPGDEHFAVARLDASGRLDAGFGRQGLAEVDFGGGDQVARGGLLQPDGKLIVFGHASAGGTKRNMAVARLLANGSLDPSFDGDGLAAVRFGDGIQSAEAAGLDAAGRLTLAGYAEQAIAGEVYREMAFARLLPDGSLDSGFGQG
ncbi:MAG TPA: delta-60 repeat domain-containing protein, partial [Anaerolineae bacterium]|nr:delta-60 repeat domain-containing protein [Anaerolineae bacterium]